MDSDTGQAVAVLTDLPAVSAKAMAQQQLQQFAVLRKWVEATEEERDLYGAAEYLTTVRELLRLQKATMEVRIEATRVECILLRKIGKLTGGQKVDGIRLSTRTIGAAQSLAALGDEDFEKLLAGIDKPMSAIHLVMLLRKEQDVERAFKDLGRIYQGEPVAPVDANISYLKDAVLTLLKELEYEKLPFSVADAALRLAERLEGDQDYWRSEPVLAALREVVRASLREIAITDEKGWIDTPDGRKEVRIPPFITYQEGEFGWMRIPWRYATVQQLGEMADLRRKQAADLTAASDELWLLYEEVRRRSTKNKTGLKGFLRNFRFAKEEEEA